MAVDPKPPLKCLVVDDGNIFLMTVPVAIKQACFGRKRSLEVQTASSGQEGVDLWEKFRPDITIMDAQMPGMNGAEATREILKLDPKALVIGHSAANEDTVIEQCMEAGMKVVLMKGTTKVREYIEKFLDKEPQ